MLDQVLTAVQQQYGPRYDVHIYIMDSLIDRGPTNVFNENITDPYGQLQHCILFWAYLTDKRFDEEDSTMFGMFKNGQLIWTAPFPLPGFLMDLFTSRDINLDGRVDLVTSWSHANSNIDNIRYIWILSWDGNSGTFINDYDPGRRYSNLVTIGNIELIDPDGDDIWDLRVNWYDKWLDEVKIIPLFPILTLPYVTYGWNNMAYGLWTTVRQVAGDEFLPANLLTVTTWCHVSEEEEQYNYTYTWSNSTTSKQMIRSIYLANINTNATSRGPQGWERQMTWLVMGQEWYAFDQRKQYMIKSGKSDNSFGLISTGLPAVVKYFVQGYRPEPMDEDPIKITEDRIINDLINNSVSGFTIGPKDPLLPFNDIDFLDTLNSYTNQSRSLGWIQNQETADKYSSLFTNVKSSLQEGYVAQARASLDTVLQQVVLDSATSLTSEAYALIRFNTEYLKNHLHEK
ncbi:MAG: hypothetical protein HYZ33_00110 [Ignavibacteriales bacterium]|nr:hypothetical protein [Ignavibacteriales bacterium]